MSKNGKLLFRNFDPYVTSAFGYRIHPLTNKKTFHAGVDYGTNNQKLKTYAIEAGKVIKTGFAKANGNYVYVNFPRLKKNAIYQHLDSISVKAGDNLTKDSVIGYVGATGEVTGIHLHFGWFNETEQNKGWYDRNWEDFEKYDYQEEMKYLGTPVTRDEETLQVSITINNLRARKTPNGEILGYIKPGIYNVLETVEKDDYLWLQVENFWIAYEESFGNLFKIEKETNDPKEEDELENQETDTSNKPSESKNIFRIFLKRLIEFIQKIFKL